MPNSTKTKPTERSTYSSPPSTPRQHRAPAHGQPQRLARPQQRGAAPLGLRLLLRLGVPYGYFVIFFPGAGWPGSRGETRPTARRAKRGGRARRWSVARGRCCVNLSRRDGALLGAVGAPKGVVAARRRRRGLSAAATRPASGGGATTRSKLYCDIVER